MSAFDPKRTWAAEDCCRANRSPNPISPGANPCCNRVLIGVVWFGNRLAARNARDAERVVARIVDWGGTGTMAGPFLFAFMISDNPDSESAR